MLFLAHMSHALPIKEPFSDLEDIGMLDVSTSMLANQASNFLATGEIPKRLGNQHPNIVPYQAGSS